MNDFIIVGKGLAAFVLAHTFHEASVTFKLIGDDNLSSCSKVAAGIWNPVVFKRLTKSWLADDLVPFLNKFYTACEKKLNSHLITQRPIIKPFTEDQEKKLWLNKAEIELSDFLDSVIYNNIAAELANCNIINQYGVVKHAGNLNVLAFLKDSSLFFQDNLVDEVFDYSELKMNSDYVTYKTIKAKNIIFCEGYLVKNNPYFNWLPLKPAKGELFVVKSPNLRLKNQIFNKNGFLMDQDYSTFLIGATYEWENLSDEITKKAEQELINKTTHLINCEYSVIEQKAGIRPSSADRRPLIGRHPNYTNCYVFNGLGTKGVMLAPYFAKKFVNFYLQKEQLINEINIERFYSLYAS